MLIDYREAVRTYANRVICSIDERIGTKSHPIIEVAQANRINWNNWLEEYRKSGEGWQTPFVVTAWSIDVPDPEFKGIYSNARRQTLTVYLVRSSQLDAVEKANNSKITALSAYDCQRLSEAFMNSVTADCPYVIPDWPVIDCTDENPANMVIYTKQAQLFAGAVVIDLRWTIAPGG